MLEDKEEEEEDTQPVLDEDAQEERPEATEAPAVQSENEPMGGLMRDIIAATKALETVSVFS